MVPLDEGDRTIVERARARVRPEVLERVFERTDLAELDPAERRLALRELFAPTDGGEATELAGQIADLIDGYGPLTEIMRDPEVTDVMVNGPREVWIERQGRLLRHRVTFDDDSELRHFVERLVSRSGGRVDVSHPIADARLSDGSRLHVVLPPLAPAGPLVSIRRFPRRAYGLNDLVARGLLSDTQRGRLERAVAERRTIAIGGGTGTGKTTLLNALLDLVSADQRVVTIEETPELQPRCPHIVSLVARGPNVEGKGTVTLTELFRAALRMRPDRIVIGEVRGA